MTKTLKAATAFVAVQLFCALSAAAEPAGSVSAPVVPAKAVERNVSIEPQRAEVKPPGRVAFQSDPIADGAILAVSLGSAGVLELINSTGEIRPQQIAPGFDRNQLISIDRAAVNSTLHPSAGTLSNIGLGVAGLFAVLDPVLSGVREQSVQTGLVDAIMYAETVSVTLALTNIVKMAVRRPRPIAYVEAEAHKDDPNYSNASTDSSLSFFSGHSSMTGAIGATATYLAFSRSPGTWRPWVTLALATTVSTLTSIYRVRAGKHFPTDVVAGTLAGAGIGIIVPHLHRSEDVQQRRVWVGFAPDVQSSGRERDAHGRLLGVGRAPRPPIAPTRSGMSARLTWPRHAPCSQWKLGPNSNLSGRRQSSGDSSVPRRLKGIRCPNTYA